MTRRDRLTASAAGTGGQWCGRPVQTTRTEATIVRAPAYDQRLYDIVRRLVASYRLPAARW